MNQSFQKIKSDSKEAPQRKPSLYLYFIPGLYQLRHKSLGEGLIFLVAAFLPLPFAWWISPFFLILSVITYIGNFQEVHFGLPPDPPDWA